MFIQVFACLPVVSGLMQFRYVLIMATMLVGFVWATWFGAVRQQRFANEMNAATGLVSQTLGDVLRNAKRVTLNGALEIEIAQVRGRFFEKRAANEGMWWSLVKLASLQYGVVGLGLLLLLLMGANDVAAGWRNRTIFHEPPFQCAALALGRAGRRSPFGRIERAQRQHRRQPRDLWQDGSGHG